ncbi:hypothetical protein O6H91_08G030700 [Diphasiastrum complanatum]|uniref:Uncharacterized protein n=1 Tax=Diphasiastrum complanatum TaxID=34168 RepID=A0ACC2CW17_DIPCM|nr:hypothetical protein O6H91_08G030700 [Diphasiastrum complanatum]
MWLRLRHRILQTLGCGSKRAPASNRFSGRGREKLLEINDELNATRGIIAAQTGAEVSSLKLKTRSTTGEWTPVLGRGSALDASAASVPLLQSPVVGLRSLEIATIASDNENLSGRDLTAGRKVVARTSWVASKAYVVLIIRNKSWKQISKAAVAFTITAASCFWFGKQVVIGTMAVIAIYLCSRFWRVWNIRRSTVTEVQTNQLRTSEKKNSAESGFLISRQAHPESAIPSLYAPEHGRHSSNLSSDSHVVSPEISTQYTPYSSPDTSSSGTSASQYSKQFRHSGRVEIRFNKKLPKIQDASSSQPESNREELLFTPSQIMQTTSRTSDQRSKTLLSKHIGSHLDLISRSNRNQEIMLRGSSKIQTVGVKVIKRPETSTSHFDITSSEYRKKVIIDGLLERPNRRSMQT